MSETTPTSKDLPPVVIEECDREAAASAYFAWIGPNPTIPAKMRAGNADGHSMVQAFARHRIAEKDRIVAWLREEALAHRKVAWMVTEPLGDRLDCEVKSTFAEALAEQVERGAHSSGGRGVEG